MEDMEDGNNSEDDDATNQAYGEANDCTYSTSSSPRRGVLPAKSSHLSIPRRLGTLERVALARGISLRALSSFGLGAAGRGNLSLASAFNLDSAALRELEFNLDPKRQGQRLRAKAARRALLAQKLREMGLGHGVVARTVARTSRTKPAPPADSSFTPKPYRPPTPIKYGAWYIPASEWVVETKSRRATSISSRASTIKPHMNLGNASRTAVGRSLHGDESRREGEAEWEESQKRALAMGGQLSMLWALEMAETGEYEEEHGRTESKFHRRARGSWDVDNDDDDGLHSSLDVGAHRRRLKCIELDRRLRRKHLKEQQKRVQAEQEIKQRQEQARVRAMRHHANRGNAPMQFASNRESAERHLTLPRVEEKEREDHADASSPRKRTTGKSAIIDVDLATSGVDPTDFDARAARLNDVIPTLAIAKQWKYFLQTAAGNDTGNGGGSGSGSGIGIASRPDEGGSGGPRSTSGLTSMRIPHFLTNVKIARDPHFLARQRGKRRQSKQYECELIHPINGNASIVSGVECAPAGATSPTSSTCSLSLGRESSSSSSQ